jgi:small conductance mechanosensitive channel
MKCSRIRFVLFLALLFSVAIAAEPMVSSAPQTVSDPEIPVEHLELLVKPLTADELIVEAEGWLSILRDKVREISLLEIEVRERREEIEQVEELAEVAEEAADAAEEAEEALDEARGTVDPAAAQEAREKLEEAREKAEEVQQVAEETESPPVDPADLEQADQLAQAAEQAQEAADDKEEVQLSIVDQVTELRDQRAALVQRLDVVLNELESKGGEVDAYRKYSAAVSGVDIDVSDTSATWTTIVGWLESEQGGRRWAWNLGKFVGTILLSWLLSIVIGRAFDRATANAERMSSLLRTFMSKMVRRIVLLVGVIVAVAAMEINISPLLAAIGGAAFVIAFALQGTLSNFASGLLILSYRPFDVGDVVDAGGVSGKVDSMNLVSTHIRTFDNKVMIVPNNQIWGNVITNATGSDERRVDLVFGIGYGDDIGKAQAILEEVVRDHELVLDDPEPVIRVHELADSSVKDITRRVKEEFDRQGVSIPFPQRDVHVYREDTAQAKE